MNTSLRGVNSAWPEIDYKQWEKTLKTLHQWTQIVGKIRLKTMPWQNHSWHTTLYLSSTGLTTGAIPYGNGIFEITFDFLQHQLSINTSFAGAKRFSLHGLSVSKFYESIFSTLVDLGIDVQIHGRPNELEDNTPFIENNALHSYDVAAVQRYWQALISVNNVFQKFRSDYVGKTSPVHFFWGAFDLAVTRFSGEAAPLHSGEAPNMPKEVMQEAYNREVSSCGFWPGADNFPEAIFYAYAYPGSEGFSTQKVEPSSAFWYEELGEYVLKYEDVRKSENPESTLLSFLVSTYEAAANTCDFNRTLLERD